MWWSTVLRILAGLAGSFVIGVALALLMFRSRGVDKFLSPILTLFQGIPALSWVVFAIIWFHGVEFRILFIMVLTTLPAFTFQMLGALRGMSRDLIEMVFSFRPTPGKTVPGDDRAGDPAGHPHRVESQSRQRLARGRGRRTGRRHRRRRLPVAAAAAAVRHGRRAGLDAATGVLRADRAGRVDADRKHRCSAIARCRSARYEGQCHAVPRPPFISTTSRRCSARSGPPPPSAPSMASISTSVPARCWRCSARPAAASRRSST